MKVNPVNQNSSVNFQAAQQAKLQQSQLNVSVPLRSKLSAVTLRGFSANQQVGNKLNLLG